ncbi:zinc dependent phospholipase C family protein [Marinilongibacter aquaticus]|uniref:zinc dependent phospholipase C family protein n=1 Tax=Marinilongibacter aquaticus TaxID=2975157 RepID=UPI0021BD53C4|nr:zinc dependent phospholipase C family protein [Marinilongibacter aquaticus]UBM58490.1 zinc dependent phospholipase C family protein [Marinilongibacter aquaticus]
MKRKVAFLACSSLLFCISARTHWGFYAHQKINRLAVFTLPEELMGFYKSNIDYIAENAVNPDQRRYAVEGEAPRHYIDWDVYSDSVQAALRYTRWDEALGMLGEDTLMAYGIVPWHVVRMKARLTRAFVEKDLGRILRLSADLGHYIADAHVPLHTTQNYNGQKSDQVGIHGFWESRLPELFSVDYSFWLGQATYLEDPSKSIWTTVLESHAALDSVLTFEKVLNSRFRADKKYAIGERNGRTERNYSEAYAEAYHEMLKGQVERRMRQSVKLVGDFWFTAWVDAGQPDLSALPIYEVDKEEVEKQRELWLKRVLKVRSEGDG